MPAAPLASSREADVAVVGAGAAGLYAALCAAREHATVVLVSAMPLAQTASYWAQGGLAAALAADDSFELHLRDTELAGRALVRHSAAEVLVHEAPDCVRDLQGLGVRFDADRFGRLALGLEGGHSVRRVVHAGGSATGQASGAPALGPGRGGAAHHRARGRARPRAVALGGPLSRPGLRRRSDRRCPRGRSRHGRGGGVVGAQHQPAWLTGSRAAAGPRRRRDACGSRAAAVPSDRRHRASRTRGLSRHRGHTR